MAETRADPTMWLPYAPMGRVAPPRRVVGAEGPYLHLEDGSSLVDAVSSWWSVIHGYNHPEITAALRDQLERVPHVMLGGLTHPVTQGFARALAARAPGALDHVFFSDSGSVGVEIALKMALQYQQNRGRGGKEKLLAFERGYHGDTCGAMAVCDPADGMHKRFAGVVPGQFFAPAPRGGFSADEEAVAASAAAVERILAESGERIAGVIVEPLLQAAGGFFPHSPAFLARLRAVCDAHDALLIFDEVATGFGRTGELFAAERAGVTPDIMVLGKGMTAGYSGHAATIAAGHVFDAFVGEEAGLELMHGPTFMGNAAVCAVGWKSLELFERDGPARVAGIEQKLAEGLAPLRGTRSERVVDVRVLGATGVVEARCEEDVAGLGHFAAKRGVWLRPLEQYAYTMPPYVVSDADLDRITGVLRDWFR